MHQPVADGDCLSCHRQERKEHPVTGGKSFVLSAKGGALCVSCHELMGKKKVVHPPVKEGECLSCHAPHGSAKPKLLAESESLSELCFTCHDQAAFQKKNLHGPVAEGSCDACHDPHETDARKLLKKGERELCLGCHQDFAIKMGKASVVHPPVRKEPCTSCHDPHGSDSASLLKRPMPELCVSCHKEVGKKIKGAKVPHKPVVQGRLCSNCHSSHFSNGPGLLSFPDEKTSCLSCHATEGLGSPPLRNMQKELAGKTNLHGPVQKGRCTGCHDPHGSDFPRILAAKYSLDFYVPFQGDSYNLCFKCHDRKMVGFAETTIYTKFRDGSRNLHYLHVNSSKGRSCSACHEPHASTGKMLIGVEGSKFGDWRVRSRFKQTTNGGSCAPGCHRRYNYDRTAFKKGAATSFK